VPKVALGVLAPWPLKAWWTTCSAGIRCRRPWPSIVAALVGSNASALLI
jgi:hypothetical protein